MPFASLKDTYQRAVRWISDKIPHLSSNAFNEFDLNWIDERIGYPGIARTLFIEGGKCHDYMISCYDADNEEKMDITMRYQIVCEDDASRVVIYSGYAEAYTGTVLALQSVAPSRYRVKEFYTCHNGQLVETLPRTEEDIGDFLGETTYVLNLVNQQNRQQLLRDSLMVVRGGLSP